MVCVFFPGVLYRSRVTGACPVTTDLIMRVNVRTTTTATAATTTTTTTNNNNNNTRMLRVQNVRARTAGFPGFIVFASILLGHYFQFFHVLTRLEARLSRPKLKICDTRYQVINRVPRIIWFIQDNNISKSVPYSSYRCVFNTLL